VERRDLVLSLIPMRPQRALRTLVSYPEQTAGSLMDPEVLALPDDITAREARRRVRSSPEHARYNVYVVDREGRLVGALNLRELFLAAPSAALASVMTRRVHRLSAAADRLAIVQHPGWREVHSLPVVDLDGRYLGALRYRTLRRLEEQLRGVADAAEVTVDALGELFAAGAGGVLRALTSDGDGAGRLR
jgi:magnesium transporter